MAHFAQIEGDTVTQVIVLPDEQEHWGAVYIRDVLGLPGEWLQCSYNATIRGVFPGIGFKYNRELDVFEEPD